MAVIVSKSQPCEWGKEYTLDLRDDLRPIGIHINTKQEVIIHSNSCTISVTTGIVAIIK